MRGDYVEISVSDTGVGIPPEILGKVFDPFFTTKEVGEGSGVGLSMVFGFAKQSKGHSSIYSEVGVGTTVKLYLPRSQEDAIEDITRDVSPEPGGGTESILVVEDDERLRNIASRTLRNQGYDVVAAAKGEKAIRHVEDGRHFDLLFTDVVLPGGMTGVQVAEQARRTPIDQIADCPGLA
jgi:hypothetical protein